MAANVAGSVGCTAKEHGVGYRERSKGGFFPGKQLRYDSVTSGQRLPDSSAPDLIVATGANKDTSNLFPSLLTSFG